MALSITSNRLTVWRGDAAGAAPSRQPGELASYLVPRRIRRQLGYGGGNALDQADFMFDLARTAGRIANLSTPVAGYARQVEIHWEKPGGGYQPIFWGDLTRQTVEAGRSEAASMVAAVYPTHFGLIAEGPVYRDARGGGHAVSDEPIEFNPDIDGVLVGNMSSLFASGSAHYWADPESFRTAAAANYQNATRGWWTLADAIESLCWACNGAEEFVKNPASYPASMATAPPLRNVTLDANKHLPHYLDALLHPNGYDWHLELTTSGGLTVRTIKIIDRGEGTLKSLKQQFGQTLNLVSAGSYTDTESFRVTTDVAPSVNECRVIGGKKQFQGTFELYRGWLEVDDDLSAGQLARNDGNSQYYNGKANVWRLWAANEAGDYCGSRITTAPIPAAPDDWSSLGVAVERRRQFEDCLSYGENGARRAPFLEWSGDGGSSWKPAPGEWSYFLLETECALRFCDNTPPTELTAAGDQARLRITATITGDARLESTATDTDGNSPNGRTNRLALDMSDAFAKREILAAGDYQSVVTDAGDETDDATEIAAYAAGVLAREVSAMVDGDYQLIGVRFDYWLGDVITGISGRNVSLNSNATGGTLAKYPQITAVAWLPERQGTIIETHAFEEEWWISRNQFYNSRGGRQI